MLSTEYKAKLDKIWTSFSLVTELSPLSVLDLINSLLFIKQLDEVESERGKMSALSGQPVEHPYYKTDQQDLRWRSFHYLDQETLSELFYQKNGVLEFATSLPEYRSLDRFGKEDKPVIPPRYLLAETISRINQLNVPDNSTRIDMISYLAHKSENAKKTSDHEIPGMAHELPHVATVPQLVKASHKIKLPNAFNKPLLFLFLSAFVVILLYFNWKKPAETASDISKPELVTKTKEKDTLAMPASVNQNVETDSILKKTPVVTAKKVLPQKDTVGGLNNTTNKSITAKSTSEQPVEKSTSTAAESANEGVENQHKENNTTAKTKGQYKILGKAYFHDEPDESTRRNAFLLHWNNSYATLRALDKKNGFIYVVFRNHQNQTSKGWLRMKDLKPIN